MFKIKKYLPNLLYSFKILLKMFKIEIGNTILVFKIKLFNFTTILHTFYEMNKRNHQVDFFQTLIK